MFISKLGKARYYAQNRISQCKEFEKRRINITGETGSHPVEAVCKLLRILSVKLLLLRQNSPSKN